MKINTLIIFIGLLNVCFEVFGQETSTLYEEALRLEAESYRENNYFSLENAIKLMEKAYKLNKNDDKDMAYHIGTAYFYRRIVTKDEHGSDILIPVDEEKGIKWFKKSSSLGNILASLVLYRLNLHDLKNDTPPYSILYFSREELKKYNKQVNECKKYAFAALSAEIPLNFNNYSTLADAALFVDNLDLARKYAAKAVDNGEAGSIDDFILDDRTTMDLITSSKGQFDVAIKLWQRGKSENNDDENGFKLFEKSAKSGYPNAQYQMGYIYLTGQVVKPDTLKAITWYKLAAENKNAKAMYMMGKIYARGIYVTQDSIKAFTMFRESMENGCEQAKWELGLCYHFGFGTHRDQLKAREYFEMFRGKYTNVDLLIGLTYYAENSPKALPLLEKCVEINDIPNDQKSDILQKLSTCYRFGRCGASIDLLKADNLLKKAAEYGDAEIHDVLRFVE